MSPKLRDIFAAVSVNLPWHRKVLGIPEADRLAAFGLFVATLALCQNYRNDGHVPTEQLAAVFPCPESDRKRLTSALIDVGLFDVESDGIQVHDYLDHNKSRDEIERAREAMSEGGHKGGKASAAARGKGGGKDVRPPLKATLEASCSAVPCSAVPCSEETSSDVPCRDEARKARKARKAPDPECSICEGTGVDAGHPCWCT
jgi:hypothetical protein